MQPKRLWTGVVLGFGLLATEPNCILAVLPTWLKEASMALRTASHQLDENVQPTAERIPPRMYNFMGMPPEQLEDTMLYHAPYEDVHPPQQAVTPQYQHHVPPNPAQPAAQFIWPQELRLMSGAGAAEGHSLSGGGNPTQYGPEPMDMQLEHAAQQSGSPWHQQHHDYVTQPYHTDSDHWYQQPHPPNLEQPASQPLQPLEHDLSRVGQEQGLGFRDSRSSPAEGHEAASSVSLSSRPTSPDGGASPSGDQFEAEELEPGDSAAASDQLVHPAAGRPAGHVQQHKLPEDVLAGIRTKTEKANQKHHNIFSLAHVGKLKRILERKHRIMFEADKEQRDAVLALVKEFILLESHNSFYKKKFAEELEIDATKLERSEAERIMNPNVQRYKRQLGKAKTEAWQYVELGKAGFFFDLGVFRIVFTPFSNANYHHPSEFKLNVEIVGVSGSKEGAEWFLYIGRTTLFRYNRRSYRLWKKRLEQEWNLGTDGLSGVGSSSQGEKAQQEQATLSNRKRARKGIQPQQAQPM
ncbi:hypothetical protein ACQY0O_005643 [Thecaphora frezii]